MPPTSWTAHARSPQSRPDADGPGAALLASEAAAVRHRCCSSRAEASTRAVGTAAVRFECGSTIARIDDGGGRFRNPSLSASLSAMSVTLPTLLNLSSAPPVHACFCSDSKRRSAVSAPRRPERERRVDRRGHLLGLKSGSAARLLVAHGSYDPQAGGYCRFARAEQRYHCRQC